MEKYGICSNCGQLSSLIGGLCIDCEEKEKEMIQVIKDYLVKHPRSNAMDISSNTEISITEITSLIKKGTLI